MEQDFANSKIRTSSHRTRGTAACVISGGEEEEKLLPGEAD